MEIKDLIIVILGFLLMRKKKCSCSIEENPIIEAADKSPRPDDDIYMSKGVDIEAFERANDINLGNTVR